MLKSQPNWHYFNKVIEVVEQEGGREREQEGREEGEKERKVEGEKRGRNN